ncbi:MAG: NAD(P)-binding domain-containing protein [Acidimicrobiales bacterium]
MSTTDGPTTGSNAYDLVIIGGTASGLSVAISSLRSGLGLVRVIESHSAVAFPELVGDNQLDIGYGEDVQSIDTDGELLIVTTNRLAYRTRAVLVANRRSDPSWNPPINTPATLDSRIHVDEIVARPDEDVLVVGYMDHAVELTATIAAAGARVVLAAGGMDPTRLSPAGEHMLRRLERERRATLLYRSVPEQIGNVAGYPMAYFADRHTPDLQFDQVVFASGRNTLGPADVGLTDAALATGKVFFVGEPDESTVAPTSPGWRVGQDIAAACFPELQLVEPAPVIERRQRHTAVIEELRDEHYNATITHFEPTHSDLWVLRIRPDHGETSHQPGQYASLGLGFWEPRIDDAEDRNLDERWDKLIRRSYSISSRMFDEHGYLTSEAGHNELEFYIVLVAPTPENVPALTPRLALKRPGDRIYLGPKVAGRYTLDAVTDPNATVLFFGTGTGEAPHNGMVVELLRKGHMGPIVSAVSVRKWADLGYLDKHRQLESRYPNYHYLPMPTREPDVPKRYIQDLITDDVFGKDYGLTLDPENTHIFLCGNPSMIGLPEGEEGNKTFPETVGVVELMTERGFTLDQRRSPGNIHYEEYW